MYTLSEDLSILLGGYKHSFRRIQCAIIILAFKFKKTMQCQVEGGHPAPNNFDLGIKFIYADFVHEL